MRKERPSLHRNKNHRLKFGYFWDISSKKKVSNSKKLVLKSYLNNKHETKRKSNDLPATRHENSDRRREGFAREKV